MWSPDAYVETLRFAAEKHTGQTLPGTDLPYVVHLSMVAMEVTGALAAEAYERPDLAVRCALLHDTIEDTETTYEEIRDRFGPEVADGVHALTKDAELPKAERMQDSLRRIRKQPREIWIVKLADRITNLQPPPTHWTPEKCRAYRAEAIEIRDALETASDHLSDRMREKIEAYAAFID